MSDSTGFFRAGVSTARSSDAILPAAGVFSETFPPASDCIFDCDAPRAELNGGELDGIEPCIGLADGLGAGALCIAGALAGEGALGDECEVLGATDAAGGEKLAAGLGDGLGAGLGEGVLGAEPA